jgi:hypothetical protein
MPTLFLMAEPGSLFGAARIGDLFGIFDQFNISRTPQEADGRALASDWIIIGDNLVDAMAEYRRLVEQGNTEPRRELNPHGQLELSLPKP